MRIDGQDDRRQVTDNRSLQTNNSREQSASMTDGQRFRVPDKFRAHIVPNDQERLRRDSPTRSSTLFATFYVRKAAIATTSQPDKKHNPPTGVIAPSHRGPPNAIP